MTQRLYPIIFHQDRTLTKPFRRRYKNGASAGQTIDFATHGITEGRLQVRDKPLSEGGAVILDLETSDGGIVLGLTTDPAGAEWSGYLFMPASAWVEELVPWGDGVYDLVLWKPDGSWVKTIFSGPALCKPTVTDWEA